MSIDVTPGSMFRIGTTKALFQTAVFGRGATTTNHYWDVSADGQQFLINTVSPKAESSALTVVLNWQEWIAFCQPVTSQDVCEGHGGVLLNDFLRGRAAVKGSDYRIQRHSCSGDTHDAVGVGVNRNPFNRFGRVHGGRPPCRTAHTLGDLSGQLATPFSEA
jgi:hypothetical protein